ncbi:hypothetical protein D3Z63_13190 [Vibrio parahaemolyticus]|uniref:Uncharacterized protein n=1 Tax=Vibrio parahaemolyticus TaxID=670 RepID=A0A249W9Z8_VIBPH|nr:hypothetical protein YA91_24565 [Vibrio parahaemolyticus]ETT19678.1 hypothetical protein D023_3171 [Vibrio parahaemolyticus 3256]ETX55962.1 hypothetical protein D020_2084 [Vibrio parahaemolyticus SBR10290]QGG32038.1 hypothetical protein GH799_02305 [Vibrio parahaemolyticus 10329]AUT85713.1 hypothetical protein RK51_001930 [Vibrio parahaemolyticus]
MLNFFDTALPFGGAFVYLDKAKTGISGNKNPHLPGRDNGREKLVIIVMLQSITELSIDFNSSKSHLLF